MRCFARNAFSGSITCHNEERGKCFICARKYFSSYGCWAHFLAMASTKWGFETIVFSRVGLLTLHPTPNLDDDFILGFTPLRGLAHA
jgi:hypothetical protein